MRGESDLFGAEPRDLAMRRSTLFIAAAVLMAVPVCAFAQQVLTRNGGIVGTAFGNANAGAGAVTSTTTVTTTNTSTNTTTRATSRATSTSAVTSSATPVNL